MEISALTFERAMHICRGIAPICENATSYAERLERDGFEVFSYMADWRASFCKNAAELEIHGRYLRETAWLEMANPFPLCETAMPSQSATSEFIDRLVKTRDAENGVPVNLVGKGDPHELWKTEIDPCARRLMKERVENRTEFEVKWRAVADRMASRLREEIAIHGVSDPDGGLQVPSMRLHRVRSALSRELAPLGFRHDRQRSRGTYLVFSKQADLPQWNLFFSIEDVDGILVPADMGLFHLSFGIRHRSLRGPLKNARRDRYLIFRYQRIVPDFVGGYTAFSRRERVGSTREGSCESISGNVE